MFKRILAATLTVAAFMIFCLFGGTAFAASEFKAELESVSATEDKLFDTALSLKGSGDVAAFVITLSYDSNCLEFKGAEAFSKDCELSVNDSQTGAVKLAFLYKDGVDISQEPEVLTFTFKAFEESEISFNLEQVIDAYGRSLSVNDCDSAYISFDDDTGTKEINPNVSDNKKSNGRNRTTESSVETFDCDKTFSDNDKEFIDFLPDAEADKYYVIYIAGAVLLLVIIVIAMIFAEKKALKKNKEGEIKDEKDP